MMQFDEVHGGGSYLSQNDLRLHFGLGSSSKIEKIDVRWPNGKVEEFFNLDGDKVYIIVEGQGIKDSTPLPSGK